MLGGKLHLINMGNNGTWGWTCWNNVIEVILSNIESNCLTFRCIVQETNTTEGYLGITGVHVSKKVQ